MSQSIGGAYPPALTPGLGMPPCINAVDFGVSIARPTVRPTLIAVMTRDLKDGRRFVAVREEFPVQAPSRRRPLELSSQGFCRGQPGLEFRQMCGKGV